MKKSETLWVGLGYEKLCDNDQELTYKIKHFISDVTYVSFYKEDWSFDKYTQSDSPFDIAKVEPITIDEFKVIQQTLKEVGVI